MVEYKDIRLNTREFVLGLLIISFSLTLGVLVPFVAPALCVLLLVTGIYAYRHAIDVGMRTIAIAAITGGILMFIMIIVIWLFMFSYTTSTSSIENYPGR